MTGRPMKEAIPYLKITNDIEPTKEESLVDNILEIINDAIRINPSNSDDVSWNQACRYIQAKIITELKKGAG